MCDTVVCKFEAIVNKLPLTADGVRFVPERDTVYYVKDGDIIQCCRGWEYDGVWRRWLTSDKLWIVFASECYSTKEVAEASLGK